MSTVKNATNGVAAKDNSPKKDAVTVVSNSGELTQEVNPELKAETQSKEKMTTIAAATPAVLPSIGDRLKKLDSLNKLLDKRVLLVDALEDVQNFVHSTTAPAKIQFVDSKNQGFQITNSLVIAEMVALAESKLLTEIEKVDILLVF